MRSAAPISERVIPEPARYAMQQGMPRFLDAFDAWAAFCIRSLVERCSGIVVSVVAALIGFSAPADARSRAIAPSAAPIEWVRYAEAATITITTWLQADSEEAIRLRSYLDETRTAADLPTPALLLKVWIDAGGRVARVDFPAFAGEQPGADLRGLIVGRTLDATPPKGMLLPLRLSVQLDPPSPGEARPVPANAVGGVASSPRSCQAPAMMFCMNHGETGFDSQILSRQHSALIGV